MTSLIEYILTAAAANVPLLLCSDPGMGKTALAAAAAKSGGYDFISFSGAVLDPVYLGGVPMRRTHGNDDGSLDFLLAGDFARLTDPSLPPTLLLIDEMNRASAPVMNLLLRLIQERKVGQYDLAPSVRIVATMNPADSGARPISAALANRDIGGRFSVSIQSDGVMMYAPGVMWTAAKHKIPLLSVMHNNRGWHQEVMHVQRLSNFRNRVASLGGDMGPIGTSIQNPDIEYHKLAESMGWWAKGPIKDPAQLGPVLKEAVEVVKRGQPALVNVWTQPR